MPLKAKEKAVEVVEVANYAIAVEIHEHKHRHKHVHIEEKPVRERVEKKPESVKVEVQRSKLDPRCERLRQEHVKKVEALRKMFEN